MGPTQNLPFTSFKKCPPTVVFHRWAGILRFIVRALQKRSEDSGLGYQPEEHYRKLAVCKIQRKDKPSVLCFKRQLRLCAVRGNAHKRFAFQQSGGQREPYPTGGLRQAACGFKCHAQVFPIRPCGHILRRKAAAERPCRCGFDLFQLRGVFCLPAHGAEGQRFAFRSAEGKLPAIGVADVRAALPQTIGALRAGPVRGPCTKLVSQLIGRRGC